MPTKARFWLSVFLGIFIVGSLLDGSIAGGTNAQEKELVVINGSIIFQKELDREIHHLKQRYAEAGRDLSEAKWAEIKEATIESLINNELLYQESQKAGVQVDDASVDWQFQATKDSYETKEAFENWLKEMNLSEDGLKAQIRRRDAVNVWINKHITEKVGVSEQEIKDFYSDHLDDFKRPEEIKVSHILLKIEPEAKEPEKAKARKTLEEIRVELKKGADFSALAKKSSQCPSGSNGGDLGYVVKGFMAEPFEEAAFALQPGEISDIVETEFGYHLIKVTEKKPEHTIPYEEAQAIAEQQVRYRKTKEKLDKFIAELKEKATIKRLVTEEP